MKRLKVQFLILVVVLPGVMSCGSHQFRQRSKPDSEATISSPEKSTEPTTASLAENPTSVTAFTPLAYPALSLPQPTPPYPGPRSNILTTQLPPTPTAETSAVDDCSLHPSFGSCGGVPLTGKLAYYQSNGRLTVLDLDSETAWSSTQSGLKDIYWSPSGSALLAHNEDWNSYLYLSEGQPFEYYDHWITWPYTRPAGQFIWLEGRTSAEIKSNTEEFLETERYLEVSFQDGTGLLQWPLEDPEFDYEVIVILDWVPQTEWLLLGYAYGPVASHSITGYQLKAINIRSGEMIDSGLAIPRDLHLDWYPSEPGLMVTTDLHKSEIMGIGDLVLWHVLENQIIYPLTSEQFVQTPVWSPDGRYLAYGAYHLSQGYRLTVLDSETWVAETWAEAGTWPRWNRDGTALIYLEMSDEHDSAQIQAVTRDQEGPWTVAVSRFPDCQGLCQPQSVFDYMP